MRARALIAALSLLVACKGESVHFTDFQDAGGSAGDAGNDAGTNPGGLPIRAFDRTVNTILHVGKSWYVGGLFNRATPYPTLYTAQLDETGSLKSCLGGFDAGVFALARAGTSLYVAGNFTSYRGAPANHIAKLDVATCALDTTFSPPSANGFDDAVYALAVAGGSLYVGGRFTAYRGVACAASIAKLDLATGALDTTFSSTTNSFNNLVDALAVSGGSLYVGGSFTTYQGVANSANRLAKLDLTTGALDTTFSPPGATANGFGGTVEALAVAGSALYVGGGFVAYRGSNSAGRIAKLDLTTGAIDTNFAMTGFNSDVTALASLGSALYVAGDFTRYEGAVANSVAKLDLATGSHDVAFNPGTTANGFDAGVSSLAVSGSALYVGGGFGSYRGVSVGAIAKLDLVTGALDTTFIPAGSTLSGFNGSVIALLFDGTSLWAGGGFTMYAGMTVHNIAKLDDTTLALDTTFSPDTMNGVDGEVLALATSGSSLYIGGRFQAYRGVASSANHLAKVDLMTGALDTTFSPPGANANGFSAPVNALVANGSALYAGGDFTAYRGAANSANYLAKLDLTTGALDTTFSPAGATANGFDTAVKSLLLAGTSLYVGGAFSKYKGVVSANRLAKLDATNGGFDSTFSPPGANGFDSVVSTLALVGTSLYAGGAFTAYRGVASTAYDLAKLDLATGALDTTFSPPGVAANGFDFSVFALAASSTALYVGGGFSNYRGVANAALDIAKLDLATGDLDTTFSPPAANGFDNAVKALAMFGSDLYVGGVFRNYRGASPALGAAMLDATSGDLK